MTMHSTGDLCIGDTVYLQTLTGYKERRYEGPYDGAHRFSIVGRDFIVQVTVRQIIRLYSYKTRNGIYKKFVS